MPLFAIGALAAAAIGVVVVMATRGGDEKAKAPAPVVTTPAPPVMPAPPPPQPVATPDPTPQTVIITITGVPEGTEVFAGGMTIGAAPGPVQLPRIAEGMVLTFKADGYLPTSTRWCPIASRR